MKCQVCGNESGKYVLCKSCNEKRDSGEIIKCEKCNKWHYLNSPCVPDEPNVQNNDFLYEAKESLLTATEILFLNAIKKSIPDNCYIYPQANLATFIVKKDGSRFQNELYRNVDFLITDINYRPLMAIEINDQSHLTKKRHERDVKVSNICEEAGIPIIKLWTKYGISQEYIKNRVEKTLASLPVQRIHHFSDLSHKDNIDNTDMCKDEYESNAEEHNSAANETKKKKGCYIATCIYGSYDCPQVWVLRRFRDEWLCKSLLGRVFVRIYYFVSPFLVKVFGRTKLFHLIGLNVLNKFVNWLMSHGVENSSYYDNN